MDVTLLILSKKKVKKDEICTELSITREATEIIVNKMLARGKITVDSDGETIIAKENRACKVDSYVEG